MTEQPQYPKVTQEDIDALLARVTTSSGVIDGTTTTVAFAFLDSKFYLGCEFSACVSPENFDPLKGEQIARDKLVTLVTNKLWELEGYRLYRSLEQAEQSKTSKEQSEDPA